MRGPIQWLLFSLAGDGVSARACHGGSSLFSSLCFEMETGDAWERLDSSDRGLREISQDARRACAGEGRAATGEPLAKACQAGQPLLWRTRGDLRWVAARRSEAERSETNLGKKTCEYRSGFSRGWWVDSPGRRQRVFPRTSSEWQLRSAFHVQLPTHWHPCSYRNHGSCQ